MMTTMRLTMLPTMRLTMLPAKPCGISRLRLLRRLSAEPQKPLPLTPTADGANRATGGGP